MIGDKIQLLAKASTQLESFSPDIIAKITDFGKDIMIMNMKMIVVLLEMR